MTETDSEDDKIDFPTKKEDNFKVEPKSFVCEWEYCQFAVECFYTFYQHVSTHLPELKVITNEEGNEMYECLWKNCSHLGDCPEEIKRHLKYHGYLTLLKDHGRSIVETKKLPPCTYSEVENSAIPRWCGPFKCRWGTCDLESPGPQEFIDHISYVHLNPLKGVQNVYYCGWGGCKSSTVRKSKLVEHVRVHSGERVVACPVCGSTFANRTKFCDHRIRQSAIDETSFQCTYCYTYLPSERLYREHMRQHIHHYKCSFCGMTCHTPHTLMVHIKFRHLPHKPFKCTSCQYSCKSEYDLKQHLITTHTKNIGHIKCTQPDCDFKCGHQRVLMKHLFEVHSDTSMKKRDGRYCCHLCEKTCSKGTALTKHLLSVHNIRKPPGYSRFIYRQDEDGNFRLQTVRLESLDVDTLMETSVEEETIDDPEQITNEEESYGGTIIDVFNEDGEIETSNINAQYIVKNEYSLPPDAKIVAVGQ